MRAWKAALRHHPDRDLAKYSMQVIQQGIWVSIHKGQVSLLFTRNEPSAYEQLQVVDKYLQDKWAQGRVLGPMTLPLLPSLQISLFGVIPSKCNLANGD